MDSRKTRQHVEEKGPVGQRGAATQADLSMRRRHQHQALVEVATSGADHIFAAQKVAVAKQLALRRRRWTSRQLEEVLRLLIGAGLQALLHTQHLGRRELPVRQTVLLRVGCHQVLPTGGVETHDKQHAYAQSKAAFLRVPMPHPFRNGGRDRTVTAHVDIAASL